MYTQYSSHNVCLTKIFISLHKTGERLTKYQVQVLMTMFQDNAFPGDEEIGRLARSLNTKKQRIKTWFDTMRAKKRKEGVLYNGEYSYQ